MLSNMTSLWIRVGRAVLVFSLAGLLAGYLIAASKPGVGASDALTHPWVMQSATAALLGSLAWAPLLSWRRLWGLDHFDLSTEEKERRWLRVGAIALSLIGLLCCTQHWLMIEDNGVVRTDLGQNSEIVDNWDFDRQSAGIETRYLWVRVEAVAPLPLLVGSSTPASPVLRPAGRSMVCLLYTSPSPRDRG